MEGESTIPLSWRSYLYANGNPLYYVDINGMYSWSEFNDDVHAFVQKFTQGVKTATRVFVSETEKTRQSPSPETTLPPSASPTIDYAKGVGKAVLSTGKGDATAAYSPMQTPTDFPVGTPGIDSYREPRDVATPTNSAQQAGFDAGTKAIIVTTVVVGGKSLAVSVRNARAGIPSASRGLAAGTEAQSVPGESQAIITGESGKMGVGAKAVEAPGSVPPKASVTEEATTRAVQAESDALARGDVSKEGLYKRGSWRKSTYEGAEQRARGANNGDLLCATCGKDVSGKIVVQTKEGAVERRGYDLDHYPDTWAERVDKMRTRPTAPTRKEVLDEYNRGDIRVQCPECNQGHQYEGVPGEYQ